MNKTLEQLLEVDAEFATIQPRANELLDQLQTTSRAEGKALKASADWAIVDRWSDLLSQRAKLRDQIEIDDVIAHPNRYAE